MNACPGIVSPVLDSITVEGNGPDQPDPPCPGLGYWKMGWTPKTGRKMPYIVSGFQRLTRRTVKFIRWLLFMIVAGVPDGVPVEFAGFLVGADKSGKVRKPFNNTITFCPSWVMLRV